jgi:exonuclease III
MKRSISPPLIARSKARKRASLPAPTTPLPPSKAPPPAAPNTLRIYSWNINGISPFLQKPITSFFQTSSVSSKGRDVVPPPGLRQFLRRHHWPALLLLQEVKISFRDTKTQDAVRTAINAAPEKGTGKERTEEPTYDAHFTLPTDSHNARGPGGSGKIYGVCSLLRRDLHNSYTITTRTVPWDTEGRVSIIEFTTTDKKLAVFNIYAVNGTENPYRCPTTGAVQGSRHDRKRAFHTLLAEEAARLEQEGWEVVLGGDMNVALDERDGYPNLRCAPVAHVVNREDFHERILGKGGFRGVDVWRELHPKERRYTYFPRGRKWGSSCDRVDYFVAGRGVWERGRVAGCGMLDSEEGRGPSDHVPIWVDVEFATGREEGEVR